MGLTVYVSACEVGQWVNSWHRSAGRYAGSNEPGFEHKQIQESWAAGSSVVAESTGEQKTEGQKAQLRLRVALLELVLPVVHASTWVSLTYISLASLSNFFLESPFHKSSPISSMTLPSSPCHLWPQILILPSALLLLDSTSFLSPNFPACNS